MPLQKDVSGAQQIAAGLNKKNIKNPASLPELIKERERQIAELFEELGKSQKEIRKLEDLISYQRDRIMAIESENKSISLKLKEKIEERSKTSALRGSGKDLQKSVLKRRS